MKPSTCFLSFAVLLAACGGGSDRTSNGTTESAQAQRLKGKQIFRFETFGDEIFWTDTLRMHEVIAGKVDPTTALSVGLKVDVEELPTEVRQGIKDKTISLTSP